MLPSAVRMYGGSIATRSSISFWFVSMGFYECCYGVGGVVGVGGVGVGAGCGVVVVVWV